MFQHAAESIGVWRPRIVTAAWASAKSTRFAVVRGTYCSPNFQTNLENAPFFDGKGGTVHNNALGLPEPVAVSPPVTSPECAPLLRIQFTLTLPLTPMPIAGWPLLIVAHGTGGDSTTFAGEKDFAGWAADAGFAAVSFDQPLHGQRLGSRTPLRLSLPGLRIPLLQGLSLNTEASFYNPFYPTIVRDNIRQAMVDLAALARSVTDTDFATATTQQGTPLLASRADRPGPPRFDNNTMALAGHSQGCHSVIMVGALHPSIQSVTLSGCGGDTRMALRYRQHPPLLPYATSLFRLAPDELDEFHPIFALLQATLDPAEAVNFGRYYRDPPPGKAAKSILHIAGFSDSYVPTEATEALATSLGTDLLGLPTPRIAGLDAKGLGNSYTKIQGNGPAHRSTLALARFYPPRRKDGHFVLYDMPQASELFVRWLRSTLSSTTNEKRTPPAIAIDP